MKFAQRSSDTGINGPFPISLDEDHRLVNFIDFFLSCWNSQVVILCGNNYNVTTTTKHTKKKIGIWIYYVYLVSFIIYCCESYIFVPCADTTTSIIWLRLIAFSSTIIVDVAGCFNTLNTAQTLSCWVQWAGYCLCMMLFRDRAKPFYLVGNSVYWEANIKLFDRISRTVVKLRIWTDLDFLVSKK